MGQMWGSGEVENVERHLVLLPFRGNKAPVLPRGRGSWTGILARLPLTATHHLRTKIKRFFSAVGQPEAWIAGTRTIGRFGAGRKADPIRFEGILGVNQPDTYLEATWQLLD